MKKFFGIGLLALLTTAYFTSSCSRDDFSGSMIEAKAEAFNEVFIETYGTPNPQHDWGFGSGISTRAFTRAAEPRANEWAATYKVPPALTEGQKNRVMKYFQYNQNPGGTTMNYSNYFVQQVYKGGDDPLTEHVGTGTYSPEQYLAANQETYITGGNNMDKLTAGTQHEHVYNFNYGDCGWNNDVLDNDQPINNGSTHSDQIMLMLSTPTTCMGYWNSNATYGHDDRYRLVSAEEIDRWASQNADKLDDVDAAVNDDWHRDFVGFDFSQVPSDKILVKTNEQYDENRVLVDYDLVYATIDDGPKTYEYIWDGTQTIKITEENRAQYLYLKNAQSQRIPFLDNKRNMYCGYERKKDDVNSSFYFTETAQYTAGAANNSSIELTNVPYTHAVDGGGTQTDNVTALNLKFINKMIGDGYYPIQEHFRTWIAPRDCADGYYSDWIVSLVRAETKNGGGGDDPSGNFETFNVQEIIDGRVFCEDLGSAEATDIDYNDVVFDAFTYVTKSYKVPYTLDSNNNKVYDYNSKQYLGYTYNKTDINLLAAGGTITISAAGQDVNQELGIDKSIMANTYVEGVSPNNSGYSNFNNGVSPVKFTVNNPSYVDLINIPIVVKMGTEVTELQAIRGSVPQKFLAPVGTPWIPERVEIQNGFPQFSNWVTTTATPWGDLAPNNLYNLKFVSNFSINSWGGSIEHFWADMNLEYPALFVDGDNQITITLENGQSLQEGDQIAITGYRKNADNAAGTLYIKCNGNVVAQTQDYNNISYDAYPNTFVFSVPSDLIGYSSFQLSRDLNGTQIYITGITVIGGLGAQRVGNYSGGNDNGNNDNNNRNNNDGTTPPEVTGPTGHTATWSGTQAFTVNADGTWSGNVWFDSNTPAFNNMGDGTYIRIYGYGTSNNWQVQLARQLNQDPWTWKELENYQRTGHSVNTSATIAFGPLSAEEVQAIKDDGKLYVHGKNFVVKYIDIDNTGVNTGGNSGGGTTDYEGTVLWGGDGTTAEPNWFGSVRATPGPKITSATGKIRFYGVVTDTNDPWITVFTTINGTDTKILDCKFEAPYVEVNVTQQIMDDLEGYAGLIINGQGYTLTAITWVP